MERYKGREIENRQIKKKRDREIKSWREIERYKYKDIEKEVRQL